VTGIETVFRIPVYTKSPLSLLPESPSYSPQVDSRIGGLGVCTHNGDGAKPSVAVLAASDGPDRVFVVTWPGCSSCAGWIIALLLLLMLMLVMLVMLVVVGVLTRML
jgi:hypothetical protein